MFKTYPIWLRAIEGTETGGSSGANGESEKGTEDNGSEPQGDGQDSNDSEQVDWKARFEKAQQDAEKWKAHSRKWEDRAKAKNDGDDSGNDDIRARLAEVEQNLKEARAENERVKTERLKFELGAEYGLSKDDVDLLQGDEEAMRALAQRLGEKSEQQYPENPYQGRGSQGSTKQAAGSWYAELTGKNTPTTA
ncbi:hypothetical protein [uncultured Corynebacterium sp.]|uniref:hypothetical protein n=1 Tax=uncultured Corynebacterium sp. TaxID=159447 RepID=UPI0025985D5F|nr:hypothetical protein [uncultured Corynebacterium sp.]